MNKHKQDKRMHQRRVRKEIVICVNLKDQNTVVLTFGDSSASRVYILPVLFSVKVM